jgi:hypothetical protein
VTKIYWLLEPHCAQARRVVAASQATPCAHGDPGAYRTARGGWSRDIPGTETAYVCQHETPEITPGGIAESRP